MTEKKTNTLAFFNEKKGYGFIKSSNSGNYFFHIRDVISDRVPTKSDILAFDVEETEKGLKAVNVEIVEQG